MPTNRASRSTWLGVACLAILAIVCLVLGLRSDVPEKNWTVLEQGDFVPIAFKEGSNSHAEYGQFGGNRFDTGGWLYLESNRSFPDSPEYMHDAKTLPDTYVRVETPSGAYTIVSLKRAVDSRICGVEIPATYPPDTKNLNIRIVAKGLKDTVIRIDRPPKTTSVVAQGATPATQIASHGVTFKGHALPIKSRKSGEICGVSSIVDWTAPPTDKWLWNVSFSGPTLPFALQPSSAQSITMDAKQGGSVGIMQTTSFPTEIRMVSALGTMDGYEVLDETTDFGMLPILTEKKSQFYLDVDKPISKDLPSGLRLTLLPMRSSKDQSIFFEGTTLYYRLKVESESLGNAVKVKPINSEKPIVEVKFQDPNHFLRIEPPAHSDSKVSHFVMHHFEKGAPSKKIHFRFVVRRRLLRERIPFNFMLPVDSTKPKLVDWPFPTPSMGSTIF